MATLSTSTSVVKIGHARGVGKDGTRAYSEQVAITDWYAYSWSVFRHSSPTVANKLAECMKKICGNDKFGYSQGERLTGWDACQAVGWDPSKVTSKVCVDCSSAVAICCRYAGFSNLSFSTTSEPSILTGLGFQQLSGSQYNTSQAGLAVGDILWRRVNGSGHTAIVVSITGESASGYLTSSGTSAAYNDSTSKQNVLVANATVAETLQKNTLSLDPNNLLGLNDIFNITTETVSREVERDLIHTVASDYDQVKSNNLLSVPSYVETPFVILQVGDYKFGTYAKQEYDSSLKVTFPNFIQGLTVTKINGTLNQYVINLVYAIQAGDDPNLVDRIFSTVGYGVVRISYGDWCMPSFIYKEEQATLTKVTTTVNWQSSQISYKVECTSNAIALASTTYTFESGTFKPSDKIKELLTGSYGLQDVFTGMYTSNGSLKLASYIASDDKAVSVPAKKMDAISYLNYLVTYMVSYDDSISDGLKKSNYYLTLYDDVLNTAGGPYFKINKVSSETQTISTEGMYEIDVGYNNPSEQDNNVINFTISNDSNWALLYNYSDKIQDQSYVFDVKDDGSITSSYSPNVLTSFKQFKQTQAQKTWWTQMTQFPIQATITMKGLVKPVLLMTNLKVNALFYGQRHVSSGIYTITKQVDTVNSAGFRTELTLQRIAGDDDYIQKTVTTETTTRTRFSAAQTIDVAADVANTYTVGDLFNEVFGLEDVTKLIDNANSKIDSSSDTDTVASASSYVSANSSYTSAAWSYLYSQTGNKYAAAGIMGNMMLESAGFHPDIKQNDYPYSPTRSAEYVNKVDSGTISKAEFTKPTFGFGLCQWTTTGRKSALYDYCKSKGTSIASLSSQLEYFWIELSAMSSTLNKLKNCTSVYDATYIVGSEYERPKNLSASINQRVTYANQFYKQFA